MAQSRNYALPDDEEVFKAMSDVLYTYLQSISKHNPYKVGGKFVEDYNYIYLDKGPNGEPRYNHSEAMRKLGLKSSTYYRKLEQLKRHELVIEEKLSNGRRIFKLPYIESKRILNLKTCAFISTCYSKLSFPPEDIIKILCLLKIYYYSDDKTFTTRILKANLGYSLTNTDKDCYVRYSLDILRSLDLIDFNPIIHKQGNVTQVTYVLTKFDDSYNPRIQAYAADSEVLKVQTELSNQEIGKVYNIKQ